LSREKMSGERTAIKRITTITGDGSLLKNLLGNSGAEQ
jgi:hypothetical protein